MTRFTKTAFAAALASLMPLAGNALKVNPNSFDLRAYRYKGHVSAPFEGVRSSQLKRAERLMTRADVGDVAIEQPTPDMLIPKSNTNGYFDGPDGKLWYYTGNFVYEYKYVSEHYSQPIMKEFEYAIFDSQMNPVGTVKDQVRYKEDESAVAAADFLPVLTRNFFNDDENYEVIIGLALNTAVYVNRNYSIAYSIGGDKKDGYDVPVMEVNMLVGDVLDASTPDKEEFYITFMEDDNEEVPDDWEPEPGDPDTTGWWKMLTSYGMRMEVYGRVDAQGKLRKLWETRTALCKLPGDQQNTPMLMSMTHNGKPYFVSSRYRDSFFNPYYNFMDESTMREDNELIVEIYTLEGDEMKLVQTTAIPTALCTEVDKVLATYTSVGNLRYRDDIIFDDKTGLADLIITTQDYQAGNDDSSLNSYAIYGPDGVKKTDIFQHAESHISMSDLPGFEPQEMFINTNIVGDYVFNFVDILSGKTVLEQSYKFDIDPYSDPERVTSNIDRIESGDSYVYAGELRTPAQLEDGSDIMRVIWFDNKGSYIRTDEVNMGKNVFYAQCYIEKGALNPNLFTTDDYNEYMILVKRGYENDVKKEEFVIGQAMNPEYPEGRQIMLLKEDEEKGALGNIGIYLEGDEPMLLVGYIDGDRNVSMDFYRLPLLDGSNASVGILGSDSENELIYEGDTLILPGHEIKVYTTNGALVASGNDRVSLAGLSTGIYVAVANGKGVRIMVK